MSHTVPRLLFADESGRVYEHPELLALVREPAGAALPRDAPVELPPHAHLASLPGRRPLGLDPRSGSVVELREMNIGRRMAKVSAVGAVLPPGWTRLSLPAYRTSPVAPVLPQWAYTAAAWDNDRGHVAYALHTDRRTHWDPATHSTEELPGLVSDRLRRDDNPLLRQLARCALEWRCFTAQNTFYVRDEGAIPASVGCNARCVGCISEQPPEGPPSSHERMEEAPDAERMARIGIAHLSAAPGRTMVSFGQGCEGEPLTRAHVIADAIRRMRRATSRGSINVNTNGSLPDGLELLIDAGLDACRISLNSAHAPLYEAYYQPIRYGWLDVERSIALAKKRGEGKPETFNFLGFTHFCGKHKKTGRFIVGRKTIRKRLIAKIKTIGDRLFQRRHDPVIETGAWLKSVVQGYFNYHSVPGNLDCLDEFRTQIIRHWLAALRRRSQRSRLTWARYRKLVDQWIPHARAIHPYPFVRFRAII